MWWFQLAPFALAQEETPPVSVVVQAPSVYDAAPSPAASVLVGAPSDGESPVPLRLSVLPGVGLAASPDTRVDGLSLGVVSHGAGLEGVDLELGWSWVNGSVEGSQLSLAANVSDSLRGIQATHGINWARGDVQGGQLAAGANFAEGTTEGLQASVGANVAVGRLDGVQLASGLNIANGVGSRGLQASSGVNIARDLRGVQAGMLNVAQSAKGFQLGLVNVGRDVEGVQLGLINVARTSDVSIAPINLIGDGLHRVDVWASESALGSAALKFGSRHVYTLLGVGWIGSDDWWTFGGGFGVHLPRDPLWLEIDATAWSLTRGIHIASGVHGKLRAQVGIDVLDHLAPFVGVSMNTWVGDGEVWPRTIGIPSDGDARHRVVSWPGLHAGISF